MRGVFTSLDGGYAKLSGEAIVSDPSGLTPSPLPQEPLVRRDVLVQRVTSPPGQGMPDQDLTAVVVHGEASHGNGTRWVLKAPGHLFALEGLLERYPDARIVHTHRDPLRVMASMASHATVLRRAFSDRAEPRKIAADWADRWARALDKFLAVRDRAPAAQFFDVGFESIESDPLGTVERVYDFLGWPLTSVARNAMARFVAANPKGKHGAHRYTLEQFGLSRSAQAARFRAYCERFSIPMRDDR